MDLCTVWQIPTDATNATTLESVGLQDSPFVSYGHNVRNVFDLNDRVSERIFLLNRANQLNNTSLHFNGCIPRACSRNVHQGLKHLEPNYIIVPFLRFG